MSIDAGRGVSRTVMSCVEKSAMKGQFVVAIEHIECLGRLGSGFEIVPGLRMLDEAKRVVCLRNENFQSLAGLLETKALRDAKLLVCTDVQDFEIENAQTQIGLLLDIVNNFLNKLWLLTEHTAYYDRGYLLESNGQLSSNTQLAATYDWEGKRRLVKIPRATFESAKLIFRKFSGTIPKDYSFPKERLALGGNPTAAHRGVALPGRFMAFVQYARQARDPALRMAFACSALEVLFSTGTSELTHRVAERVAFLLGTDARQRQDIYSTIKRLYAIRSSFLHGDSIKKSEEGNLSERVRDADRLLRQVAVKLYSDEVFQKAVVDGKEELDNFHTKLLFK